MKKNIIKEKVKQYRENIIKDTCELLQIKSILDSPLNNQPFGEGINKALDYMLTKGKELGFSVENFGGYAGHIEIGKGKESAAAVCHLDVVPEGDGWSVDPFGGVILNDKIYGRGAIDDKGPAIACLYALKIIKDVDIKLNKKLRLVLGTDEETGCRGIEYYLDKTGNKPVYGFSPDGEFPIIFAEKGIIHLELTFPFEDERVIKEIKSGNRANMVPDFAKAIINIGGKLFLEKYKDKITIDKVDGNIHLSCVGKSAHGSTPQEGINAASYLIKALCEVEQLSDSTQEVLKFLNENIGSQTNGKNLGIFMRDDVSGELTLNLGTMEIDRKGGKIVADIRYPVTKDYEDVYSKICSRFDNSPFKLAVLMHKPPLYIPKDKPIILMLQKAYEAVIDQKAQPIAIGGGTYCRNIENTVAFGPVFPGDEELAHKADENISIDNLLKLTEIYTHAFINMGES